MAEPDTTYQDADQNILSAPRVIATNNFLSSLTTHGMAMRLGTESKPITSFALRFDMLNMSKGINPTDVDAVFQVHDAGKIFDSVHTLLQVVFHMLDQ
jgi:hypothetical protein